MSLCTILFKEEHNVVFCIMTPWSHVGWYQHCGNRLQYAADRHRISLIHIDLQDFLVFKTWKTTMQIFTTKRPLSPIRHNTHPSSDLVRHLHKWLTNILLCLAQSRSLHSNINTQVCRRCIGQLFLMGGLFSQPGNHKKWQYCQLHNNSKLLVQDDPLSVVIIHIDCSKPPQNTDFPTVKLMFAWFFLLHTNYSITA